MAVVRDTRSRCHRRPPRSAGADAGAHRLSAQIEGGELSPGDRLPSITALSQQYDLAMTTVRKALDALKSEGLVVTSPMGTFVAQQSAPPAGEG